MFFPNAFFWNQSPTGQAAGKDCRNIGARRGVGEYGESWARFPLGWEQTPDTGVY